MFKKLKQKISEEQAPPRGAGGRAAPLQPQVPEGPGERRGLAGWGGGAWGLTCHAVGAARGFLRAGGGVAPRSSLSTGRSGGTCGALRPLPALRRLTERWAKGLGLERRAE